MQCYGRVSFNVALSSSSNRQTYHVETMPAFAHYDGTVVARELALATCAFEVDSADTARVV
jgi:hypothetical protein